MASTILGRGLYDLSEAARLTGLKRKRVREWFEGRDGGASAPPLFQSGLPTVGGSSSIDFLDLVEVFVAGRLRDHGVSLQYIRRAHARLRHDWDTDHPFSKKEIRTDGRRLFAFLFDDEEHHAIYDVVTKNRVFESVILPTLSQIDYGRVSHLAEKWRIAPSVVLDPAVCFGRPIVESIGITTRVLADSYFAHNQNAEAVASWFEIDPSHVRAAVAYEAGAAA